MGKIVVEENSDGGVPENGGVGLHRVDNLRGNVDEYRYDKQKQKRHKDRKYPVKTPPEVHSHERGQIRAAVAHRHHSREEVVRRARNDVANRDYHENYRPEFNPQNHADNWPYPRDIEQLDKHILPVRQADVVDAVELRDCGSRAVVGGDHLFDETPVGHITGN